MIENSRRIARAWPAMILSIARGYRIIGLDAKAVETAISAVCEVQTG